MKRQLLWLSLAFISTGCSKKQKEIHAETRLLTSAVYASGSLVPEQEYKVVSSVDGYLTRAMVKEGDAVHQGQLLFKVSSEVRNAQEAGAHKLVQKTIPTATDNAPLIKDLEEKIAVARLKKHDDSLQYMRYKILYEQNATSKTNYEQHRLQYQTSDKNHQGLIQQLKQQRLSGKIQLQTAQNQLLVAAAQSDIGNLRSFVDGTVYEIYKKEGDLITPNQPIALVGKGKMFAKLLIDENDLEKITPGQKVLITMDAYPDKVFNAHIDKIYPLLSKVEQSFRADAVIDDPLPTSMYGLNLEANIVTAEKKRVLAIPKAAIQKGDTVIVKKDGEEVKVKVKKGIEDDQYVEVLGGLDSSSAIIIKQ
jgi:HlyD family secretion protein